MLRFVNILALLMLLGACASPEPSNTLDGLLKRVEHAYGEAARMKALRQSGQLNSASREAPARVSRYYVYPDKLRIDILFTDGSGEQRLLNGDRGWRHGRESRGPGYAAMRLQAARIGLPRMLTEQRARVRELPSTAADGEWRTVELALDEHLSIVAHIDTDTGRIIGSQGLLATGSTHLVFDARYDDFRQQGDALFAFKETHGVMGRLTGQTVLEHVELLPSLADDLFMPSTTSH